MARATEKVDAERVWVDGAAHRECIAELCQQSDRALQRM